MKIKTLLRNEETGVISIGLMEYTPDSATKASAIFVAGLVAPGDTTVIQTNEALRETAGAGSCRFMAKSTMRVPRILSDGTYSNEFDVIPVHTVIALPKSVQAILSSAAPTFGKAKAGYSYLIAKQLHDNHVVTLGKLAAPTPSNMGSDHDTLAEQLLAPEAPLRRAIAGLQPMNTTSGEYGVEPEVGGT